MKQTLLFLLGMLLGALLLNACNPFGKLVVRIATPPLPIETGVSMVDALQRIDPISHALTDCNVFFTEYMPLGATEESITHGDHGDLTDGNRFVTVCMIVLPDRPVRQKQQMDDREDGTCITGRDQGCVACLNNCSPTDVVSGGMVWAAAYPQVQTPTAPTETNDQMLARYHKRFDARTTAAIAKLKAKGKDVARANRFCLNPRNLLDIDSCTYELEKLGAKPARDRFRFPQVDPADTANANTKG